MSDAYFWKAGDLPQESDPYLATAGGLISSAISALVPGETDRVLIEFLVATTSSAGTTVATDVLTLEVGYNTDRSQIQIGDEEYALDIVIDSAITGAATIALLAVGGIAASSVLGIVIGGAVTLAYSKFVDPIQFLT